MAQHMFRIPDPIENFTDINWEHWKQKFEIYLKASKSISEDEDIKIAILLNALGDEGLVVYNTFEEDQKGTYDLVIKAFDDHVLPKKNITMETFKFNNLQQKEDQPIESFLLELKTQAQYCEFKCENEKCHKSYIERMLRDKLIIGLCDKQVQQRFIREPGMTVKKIIDFCKSVELSKQHIKILNPEESVSVIRKPNERKLIKCHNCLYEHLIGRCPAYNKTCAACQGRNHFAKACTRNDRNQGNNWGRSNQEKPKHIRHVEEEEGEDPHNTVDELLFIHRCLEDDTKSWYEEIEINGFPVKFKLDTGAQCSILPKNEFVKLNSNIQKQLQTTKVTLVCYSNFRFKSLGQIYLPTTCKGVKRKIRFVVVDIDAEPLLSLEDCVQFNLIARVNSIVSHSLLTKDCIYKEYNDVFEGLGKVPGLCTINLTDDAKPIIQAQRKIPYALQDRLKQTLLKLEENSVISKVDYPTDWVNSLMIVEKPDKSLRICLDPKPLNKFIRREHFLIPTNEDIISKLTGKSIFSVIDMKDGFWQIELDEKSSILCTFNTPFGRYKFNRLPFGVSSAPEIFQKRNFKIFGDIEGVDIYFDDIIISGESEFEHDIALKAVLERARVNNIKFNFKKFQYKLTQVTFMGQIISSDGVRPDEKNMKAVLAIENPKNRSELLRILGMLKFFSKFIPNLSALSANLRDLTKKSVPFNFTKVHEDELNELKAMLTNTPTLRIFDPKLETVVQCDASGEGLGCCLMQLGHPVAFASRSLSNAEKRYAQIEKELLSIVFACEKFHYFIYGHEIVVQTDHSPLVPIFKKNLDKVSNRLQRMLLRLLKYHINIIYVPGKNMYVADTLSRAFIKTEVQDDPEMEYIVHALSNNVPMSEQKKLEFKKQIDNDETLAQIKQFCQANWPENDKKFNSELKHYYKLKEDIYLSNDLLFLNHKVIVPNSLQKQMLNLIHEPHFGVVKSKLRARQNLYWPNLSKDIEKLVLNCKTCQTYRRSNQKEPLINYPIPIRPWQYVHSDICEYKNKIYIVLVDAYSNWIEVKLTNKKTANDVINFLKSVFSQFGVPDVLYADNVPYNSNSLNTFASEWNFDLKFSSPYHHQSNGLAEKAVGILKSMLKKNNDNLELCLMEYRNTPLPSLKYSPSQLLLNRSLKTKIPASAESLKNSVVDSDIIQGILENKQSTQKYYFDKHVKELPKLNRNEKVMIQKGNKWECGKVENICNDRSYIVTDEFGNTYRRNRRFLRKTNVNSNNSLLHDDILNDSSASDNLETVDETNSLSDTVNNNNLATKRIRKTPEYLSDYIC